MNVHGCYFHFSQALWKRVQRVGLAGAYRRNPLVRRFVQKTMALGFLPLNIVRPQWDNLRNSPNTQALVAANAGLQRFIHYFTRNWMNPNGVFRPQRWNVHNTRMEYRTNNAIEAYNRAWNWFVAARRPSLWVFLTKLKQRQAIHEVQINNMMIGVPPPRRKLKWRLLERHITRETRRFRCGAIAVDLYWNRIMHLFQRFG